MNHVFPAVKAIVIENGKFLVIKQVIGNKTFWEIPGGKVEFGESPFETLKREVKEETNLEIEIIKPAGLWWFFRIKDGDQVVCSTFICRKIGGRINLSKNPSKAEVDECKEFRWITKKEFLSSSYSDDRENDSLRVLIAKSL